jgi:hypothetical protein
MVATTELKQNDWIGIADESCKVPLIVTREYSGNGERAQTTGRTPIGCSGYMVF